MLVISRKGIAQAMRILRRNRESWDDLTDYAE
jgi:hypothetical protein